MVSIAATDFMIRGLKAAGDAHAARLLMQRRLVSKSCLGHKQQVQPKSRLTSC